MTVEIPGDVVKLAGWRMKCSCGIEHKISTKAVVLEPRAIERLPAVIQQQNLPKTVWLLADENTFAAAGDRVCQILKKSGLAVETTILKAGETGYVGADEEYLAQARRGVWDQAEVFVGVGSGVINDLARLLVAERKTRYIAVATAASMNGYGSPISAVIENGVKVTKQSAPTDVIVADLDVLTAAPVHLSQSGFGDLLAKNSSNADWHIAGLVTGGYYCQVPVNIVRRLSERCVPVAPQIKHRDPAAIRILTEGLIGGAFAMDAAGVTAPASGGEHLISHYMEMVAHLANYPPALHGQQVALGTLIAAALYEAIRRIDIDRIDFNRLADEYPDWPERERQIVREHGSLAEIVMPEAKAQHLTRDKYRARLETIRRSWPKIWQYLDDTMLSTKQIRQAYLAAGTPTRAKDLAIPPELVAKAYHLARDIRARYTILHLAGDLGLLDPLAQEVFDASGVLA